MFMPFVESHLNDEHRSDAILCLTSLCVGDPKLTSHCIDRIIGFLGEDLDCVLWCLGELFSVDNLEMKWDWWDVLVAGYENAVVHGNGADSCRIAGLVSWFLSGVEVEDACVRCRPLYDGVVNRLFEMQYDPMDISVVGVMCLIAAMISVVKPPFSEDINRLMMAMRDFMEAGMLVSEGVVHCCEVLKALVVLHPNEVWGNAHFEEDLRMVTQSVEGSGDPILMGKEFFELVRIVLERFGIHDSEIGQLWLDLELEWFQADTGLETLNCIAEGLLGYVPYMSLEVVAGLMEPVAEMVERYCIEGEGPVMKLVSEIQKRCAEQ
jgi:hypothetical protein